MTNEEIIDVVSAHEAGMRVQHKAKTQKSGWLMTKPSWDFRICDYRVFPEDAEKWERIKADALPKEQKYTGHVRCRKCGQSHWMHGPCPDLPPLPEGAVLLPVDFKKPEGDRFCGWMRYLPFDRWEYGSAYYGDMNAHGARYAVPADSEIARLNGVGFGPCPSPHGWHNPADDTPQEARVPERRLLCRDEIGNREYPCDDIEIKSGLTGIYGASATTTYYARLKYEVLHRESGIKVGDTVRVIRKAESYERGWDNGWTKKMDKYVDTTLKVLRDCGQRGFDCDCKGIEHSWTFPAYVLEKLTPQMVPLEGSDWKPGDVVRKIGVPHVLRSVVAINLRDGCITTGGIKRVPKEMQRNWERLDPATGEWVRCEKEQQGK